MGYLFGGRTGWTSSTHLVLEREKKGKYQITKDETRECWRLSFRSEEIFLNRPFAAKPSRDLLFIKLWAIT